MISGSRDGKIRIIDLIKNECIKVIDAHQDIVTCLSLTQDEKQLLSASADQSICLWDTNSWKCLKQFLKHKETVNLIKFSPSDGYFISGSNDGTLKFWDSKSYKQIKQLDKIHNTGFITDFLTIQTDESQIAIAGPKKSITFVDRQDQNKTIANAHDNIVRSVLFTKNANQLISGDQKGIIKIWNVQKLSCQHILNKHSDQIRSLILSPNQQLLISSSADENVIIWILEIN